jgi:hypothetical protein
LLRNLIAVEELRTPESAVSGVLRAGRLVADRAANVARAAGATPMLSDARSLIWRCVCQAGSRRRIAWAIVVAVGRARRLVVDAFVSADMRGSVPHDRVCDLRERAAL